MKLDSNKYVLFRLSDEQLVAVDEENLKVLEHCMSVWKQLEKVPVDRTVRGVFVRKAGGELFSISDSIQQNDITINQLIPLE
jgi:hypothetical protein